VQRTEIEQPTETFMIGEHISADGMYDYNNYQYTNAVANRFATYHNGGSNVLWCDGHASSIKEDQRIGRNYKRVK
jgi:prepilin-type processing-associated H-X9-DG protein